MEKVVSNSDFQLLKSFLKIIADENRLKILFFLKERERCVCEIWEELSLPQNLVSHHLKILRNFDLISSRKEGRKVIYTLDTKTFSIYARKIDKLIN